MKHRIVALAFVLVTIVLLSTCEVVTPLDSDKSIIEFSIPLLDTTVNYDESAKTIEVSVPWNTDLSKLTPTITHTGTGISPASGLTVSFTNPQTYTITAADGSMQDYTVTFLLKKYAYRDIGPAGGWVFYENPNADIDGWKYLEAAPASTEWEEIEWGKNNTAVTNTSRQIGSGKINTNLIFNVLNIPPADENRAAQLCENLSYVGYEDWFLPSEYELREIYDNLVLYTIGDFDVLNASYWSSSEYESDSTDQAWTVFFGSTSSVTNQKNVKHNVRAIRLF